MVTWLPASEVYSASGGYRRLGTHFAVYVTDEGDEDPDVRVVRGPYLYDAGVLMEHGVRAHRRYHPGHRCVDPGPRLGPHVKGASTGSLSPGRVHNIVLDLLGRGVTQDQPEQRVPRKVSSLRRHLQEVLAFWVVPKPRYVLGPNGTREADPGGLRQHHVRPRIIRVYRERLLTRPRGLNERHEDERQDT